MENKMAINAICRNLEIIGEAANKLGEPFRAANPHVPWRSLINARNILIHAYDIVNPFILEDIVLNDIPELLAHILQLIESEAATN